MLVSMRKRIMTVLLFLVCMLESCSRNDKQEDLRSISTSKPAFFLYRTAGSVESVEKGRVIAALWSDRRIVRVQDLRKTNQPYLSGYLSPGDFDELMKLVGSLSKCDGIRAPLDATIDIAGVPSGEITRTWEHSPERNACEVISQITVGVMRTEIQQVQLVESIQYEKYPAGWF